MTYVPQSPYARAIGDRMSQLHPQLQQYFATIPEGHVGRGEGRFDRVGTPHRWLQPLLRPLERRSVLFAGWREDVPFRVTNRTIASRAVAERELLLGDRIWTMRDAVAPTPHGRVVDELGEPGFIVACFDVEVRGGALHLTSRAVGIRIGRLRLRVPRMISPVVRLTERVDEERGRQRVDVTIDAPLFGRVYEYGGDFVYRIEKEER